MSKSKKKAVAKNKLADHAGLVGRRYREFVRAHSRLLKQIATAEAAGYGIKFTGGSAFEMRKPLLGAICVIQTINPRKSEGEQPDPLHGRPSGVPGCYCIECESARR